MKKLLLGSMLFVALLAGAQGAEEKGFFGFKVAVETSGFMLNPTVKKVMVESVVPGSPAAEAHIATGDEIVEADGFTVPGGKALQLRPIMQKSPGQSIHLKLKRTSGENYSVDITAGKRPS